MNSWSSDTLFFLIWFGHMMISLLGIGIFVYWSILHRQWSGQGRARYLALWAHLEGEQPEEVSAKRGEDGHVP